MSPGTGVKLHAPDFLVPGVVWSIARGDCWEWCRFSLWRWTGGDATGGPCRGRHTPR